MGVGAVFAFTWFFHATVLGMDPVPTIRSAVYSAMRRPILELQNGIRSDLLWCGFHNMAPFPSALSAVYPNLDNCCRQHDMCPMAIDRGECLDDVCNMSFLFPILSCECERQFSRCLKRVTRNMPLISLPVTWSERLFSDKIGLGYFQLIPRLSERQCVERSKPIVGCAEKVAGKCTRLIVNPRGRDAWQLFRIVDVIEDSPIYF